LENDRSESNRTVHEIEGIGSIRAMNGTALETIAGAAAYWQNEAKTLEGIAEARFAAIKAEHTLDIETTGKRKWRDGFLTGCVSTATLFMLASLLLRFLY
jgi:hypothetical protein